MHTSYAPSSRLPQGRAQLVQVLRKAGDVINITDVAGVLNLSRTDAAKRLSRWTEQGWLRRVGRGAYVSAAVDVLDAERVIDDPWVLVPALFAPCYIGGRTAAEHWNLTEQIFNDIVVVTTQYVRDRHQIRHGASFTLKHVSDAKLFGVASAWRHQTKVPVSDLDRTIVDILDEPSLGGGIQHVFECVSSYFLRADGNDARLIDYATRLGNGAVFKRLGFMAERHPRGEALVEACKARLTTGNAKLDPDLDCPRLISKWRLFVPLSWTNGGRT